MVRGLLVCGDFVLDDGHWVEWTSASSMRPQNGFTHSPTTNIIWVTKRSLCTSFRTSGRKHGKVDQKTALVYWSRNCFGPRSEVAAKRCLNWTSFHDDLCCCMVYSTVENRVEILNTISKSDVQKQMVESSLDVDFMTLTILKLGFSFTFLVFNIYFITSTNYFVEIDRFNVIWSYFKQIFSMFY